MSDEIAIRITNLSKRYEIGELVTMRDLPRAIKRAATAPWRVMTGRMDDGRTGREEFWALDDVSFEVPRGQVVGIIGANGAGKSTLLKILSRVTAPTSGRADLYGRVGALLEVGTGFHAELTGRENVYLNGTILGMRKREIDAKFDEIVQFAGVEKYIDTPVKRYSSGMKVRLGFAVAAHLEPEILIIDEVLAVGDIEFQRRCIGKMREVATSGRTVLFVSHKMGSIDQLCDRAILLDGGRIVDDNEPSTVIHQYAERQHARGRDRTRETNKVENAEVRLEEAEVLDADGNPTETLQFREPFGIRLHWRHARARTGYIYKLRVVNDFGDMVFVVNTRRAAHVVASEPGANMVECRIEDNVLIPGFYQVDALVSMPGHRDLQIASRCAAFAVIEAAWDPEHPFTITASAWFAPRYAWKQVEMQHELHA